MLVATYLESQYSIRNINNMRYEEFIYLLDMQAEPDASWSVHLRALWYDKKGDCTRAHDLVDQLSDAKSAHIHAYLHRVEGDQWNAEYWYGRAKQPVFKGTVAEEWESLLRVFI